MKYNIKKTLVFSYGTLKRGYPNHFVMNKINAVFITEAISLYKYPLIVTGKWNTPFLIDRKDFPDSYRVHGELFELDKNGLDVLDEFEGVEEKYYKRARIELRVKSGNHKNVLTQAWCYFRYDSSEKLLKDPSTFIPVFGKKESEKYIVIEQRTGDRRNK